MIAAPHIKPVGLMSYRWNNNLKSAALLAAFPALLLLLLTIIVGFCGVFLMGPDRLIDPVNAGALGVHAVSALTPVEFAIAAARQSGPYVVGVALAWLVLGYLFQGMIIRSLTGARPVTRTAEPELYNLLENLCISRGLRMPALHIMESPQLNAFASGLDERTYAVTVTRGLMEKLNRDELEAVLAHELTHIMNRDVRLLIVCVVFVGMISLAADLAWRGIRHAGLGRRSQRSSRNPIVLVFIAALALSIGYVLALMLRLAVSRRREFMADAGAVELTKNPDAMIAALQKISGKSAMPEVPPDVRQMFIDNPPGLAFFEIFATHPPIEARIGALQALGGQILAKGDSIIPSSG